jgi:glycosyltransferase involved in cell wall biosynthesis
MAQPILSLLFPLYNSHPFFDNLVCQLEQLSDPRYEIIISDRHCYDNTIDLLQEKFKDDPRFRFIKATDHLNWVSHYNFLLQNATGKYFCWVPHDDDFKNDYYSVLINKMEQSNDAIVAFATLFVNGSDWEIDYSNFKTSYQYPLSSRQYIKLLNSGVLGIMFRGVFKRNLIVDQKLWIRQKGLKGFQDMFWTFGVILHGGLIYTEQTSSTKNYFNDSAQSSWKMKMMSKKNFHVFKVVYQYIYSSPLPFYTKIKMSLNVLMPYSLRKQLNKLNLDF